jgi:hypothetical protein
LKQDLDFLLKNFCQKAERRTIFCPVMRGLLNETKSVH